MINATNADQAIRPQTWDEYVGQNRMKGNMDIMIQAAVRDERRLDHVLLVGPPGVGKTAFASLIAARLYDDFCYLKMKLDTDTFFTFVEDHPACVIMLDELHLAPVAFQEMLLSALEDGKIITKENWEISVKHICFIGATTTQSLSKIIEPLRDRFEIKPTWDPYTDDEMADIITGMATRLGFEMPIHLAKGLSRAAGGTPRLAKPLVKRTRDLLGTDRTVTVEDVLELVGIDEDGLEAAHMEYLRVLKSFDGGRAGQRVLGSQLRLDNKGMEDLERLLCLRGLIRLESTGRRITPAGKTKLQIAPPVSRLNPAA